MKRDLEKELNEYKEMNIPDAWQFYASDMRYIYDNHKTDLFMLIETALEIGFMRGYKYAKREAKKTKEEG